MIRLVSLILMIERKLQVRGDSLGATYVWIGSRSMGFGRGPVKDPSDIKGLAMKKCVA